MLSVEDRISLEIWKCFTLQINSRPWRTLSKFDASPAISQVTPRWMHPLNNTRSHLRALSVSTHSDVKLNHKSANLQKLIYFGCVLLLDNQLNVFNCATSLKSIDWFRRSAVGLFPWPYQVECLWIPVQLLYYFHWISSMWWLLSFRSLEELSHQFELMSC